MTNSSAAAEPVETITVVEVPFGAAGAFVHLSCITRGYKEPVEYHRCTREELIEQGVTRCDRCGGSFLPGEYF